jgi:hypothetical protein
MTPFYPSAGRLIGRDLAASDAERAAVRVEDAAAIPLPDRGLISSDAAAGQGESAAVVEDPAAALAWVGTGRGVAADCDAGQGHRCARVQDAAAVAIPATWQRPERAIVEGFTARMEGGGFMERKVFGLSAEVRRIIDGLRRAD